MSKQASFDVIVVGGGLVGAALALALGQRGVHVALLEQALPPPLPQDASVNENWDARIYAITPGNVAFLRRLGAWDGLDASRIAAIHAMHVWGDDARAKLDFDAYDVGVPELGVIAESRLMLDGLWHALQAEDNVEILTGNACAALQVNDEAATLQLADGSELRAQLVVGADGGESWVRRQSGIEVHVLPYEQLGVVANFATEKDHGGVARQWFMPDGILAYLPLPDRRISIVWSAYENKAQQLMALDAEAFCAAVAEAGRFALGKLQLITPPQAFALRMQHNASLIGNRVALVGDAAHRVHPLAGHGVNLGFRDAQELVSVLLEKRMHVDLGNALLLRRYERARKADIMAMQAVTYGLQKLFNNQDPLLGWLRNFGLNAVDHVAPLKRRLMAYSLV